MKKILFISILSFAAVLVSCKKDASQFQGQVRFVDSTGAYYPAPNAAITFHINDTSKTADIMSETDAEGIFNVMNVPDGIWVVKAMLMVDSTTTYVGVTDKLECSGQEIIAAPIDMVEI